MSTAQASLSELMNALIARMEYAHAEDIQDIPEARYWHMIEIYIQVDEILASLYKQYCDAKENLGKLLVANGSDDPMTEIAWDMHDGLRSAIETRLIELKDDKAVAGRVAALQSRKVAARLPNKSAKQKSNAAQLNEMMAFVLWAGMVMNASTPNATQQMRDNFYRAS